MLNSRLLVRRLLALLAALPLYAYAADVTVSGTMQGRAMLTVDGVARIYNVGQTVTSGVRLVEVEGNEAVLEVQGRKQRLAVGQRVARQSSSGVETAVLHVNAQGHYLVSGSINGLPVRFLVDTGATMVSMGRAEATRLGLNLSGAESGTAYTANGPVPVMRVRLDRVNVGDITLDAVDALVHEHDLPIALLGMSFLNRTDMKFEGNLLKLKKRY
jgi:aspartyl protease family protein